MQRTKRKKMTARKVGASRQAPNTTAFKINFSFVRYFFLAALFFAAVYAVVYLGNALQSIKVEEIIIYGNEEKVSSQAINRLVAQDIQKSFWSLDMKAIKENVETHAWVRKAMIKKQWPNKLVIAVDEQVPIARWDNDQLLSTTGDIIYGGSLIGYLHLPKFIADKSKLELVISHFNDLQRALRKNQLAVTTIRLSASGQWSFELNDEITVKIGDEINQKKIDRLVLVVEKELTNTLNRVAVIDLRYPNGLSISWRDSEPYDNYAMNNR